MRGKLDLKNKTILWCAFIFLLVSCSKEPEAESFVNITDQYELKLHQELTQNGGVPSLHVSSIENYECTNSYISHTSVILNGKSRIYLNDILTEGACIPGESVVTENISIITSMAVLPIEINVKNIIQNQGTLYSENSKFDLKLSEFDGLKINKTQINRIQPPMIWGSYSTNDAENAAAILQYLKDTDLDYSELKGDYGLFYVTQNNSITIYEDENDFTFLISSAKDFNNFKSKILEFKELDSSLVFQATNYDGSALNIH